MKNKNFLKTVQYTFNRGIVTIFCIGLFAVSGNANAFSPFHAPAANKDYEHWTIYVRGKDDAVIKRNFANGKATVVHNTNLIMNNISETAGNPEWCSGQNIAFTYVPRGVFNGTGGYVDTPFMKWVTNINENRKGEKKGTESFAPDLWQRVQDKYPGSNGRGYVALSAIKPRMTLTSSNPRLISCNGVNCSVVGTPNRKTDVKITANYTSTPVRLWSYYLFHRGGKEWVSEHFDKPRALSQVKSGQWMFCPTVERPSNNRINYCTNRFTIPATSTSWTVTVNPPQDCPICGPSSNNLLSAFIDQPANNTQIEDGQSITLKGHSNKTVKSYAWVDARPGTPSYDGERCYTQDGYDYNGDGIGDRIPNSDGAEVAVVIPRNGIDTHKICLNVKDTNDDWIYQADGCQDMRTIIIKEKNEPGSCPTSEKIFSWGQTQWPLGSDNDYFCSGGQLEGYPALPVFPTLTQNASWRCLGTGSDAGQNATCSARITPPAAVCGSKGDGVGDDFSASTPVDPGLCCTDCFDDFTSVWPSENGLWKWTCTHNVPQADPGTVQCEAPSCLATDLLEVQSAVYLQENVDDQRARVTVSCPGQNVCCQFESTEMYVGGNPVTEICTGQSGEIAVPASGAYPAQCYYEEGPPVEKTPNVQTICAARSCTAQGICQSTPTSASSLQDENCRSTCSTNADCTSGRMIETRP